MFVFSNGNSYDLKVIGMLDWEKASSDAEFATIPIMRTLDNQDTYDRIYKDIGVLITGIEVSDLVCENITLDVVYDNISKEKFNLGALITYIDDGEVKQDYFFAEDSCLMTDELTWISDIFRR